MTYLDHVGPKVLALSIEHKEVKTLQVSIEKTWDPISMDTKLGSFQPYFRGKMFPIWLAHILSDGLVGSTTN